MEICIVGGGLAGLASAISLADAFSDIKITVLELRNFTSKGATLGLALNGQKAMEEICPSLLEELKGIGILMSTGGYMLPWYRVRDGLLAKAQSMPTIHILANTKVTSISREDNTSHVSIEAIQTGEDESSPKVLSLQADVCIGADGLHSTVRNFLPAPSPISSNAVCWRGFVNKLPAEISHMLEIPIFKMLPCQPGSCTIAIFNFDTKLPGNLCWVITSKDASLSSAMECLDYIEDEKERDDFRILLEASSKDAVEFKTELCTVPLDDCWGGEGRMTIIGDAAHALRPASGLGGSLAFEDVVILTRALSKNPEEPEKALRDFEKIRLPRCRTIQEDQTRIAEAAYKTESDRKKLAWHPSYKEWVFGGPDVSPNPPAQMYIE